MMAFLLLVTWLGYAQSPSHYQVEFSSNEACEAARLKLIKDAERIGQSMIERATAQDRQIGSNNFQMRLTSQLSVFKQVQTRRNVAKKPVTAISGVQAIFCRRRHQPSRPPTTTWIYKSARSSS
jgi:hypothetical protein